MERKKEFRLSEERLCNIAKELARVTGDDPCTIYLGGSQSPINKKFPTLRGDIDFFVFPSDFNPKNEADWKRYASKIMSIDKQKRVLEKSIGRRIDYSYLPMKQQKTVPNLVRLCSNDFSCRRKR